MIRLPRDSELLGEVIGPAAQWGPTEHLLATAVDALRSANWQRGGAKAGAKPKPIPRPGRQASDPRSTLTPPAMADRLRQFHRRAAARTHRR